MEMLTVEYTKNIVFAQENSPFSLVQAGERSSAAFVRVI